MHPSTPFLHETPETNYRPRLRHAGAHVAEIGQDALMHWHDIWEWVYYREGHIEVPIGDAVHESRPGLLLLTPPHTPHAEYARTSYANYHLGVDAPADMPWPRAVFDDSDGSFGHLCRGLVREWMAGTQESEALIDLMLVQFDLLLRRASRHDFCATGERWVREVELLFEERFASPLSITGIAREKGISPSALRAHFAARRGGTPSQGLQKVRLRHALAQLETSEAKLEVIAANCGFHSASHLSRHVKAATGKAPGAWRKRDEIV